MKEIQQPSFSVMVSGIRLLFLFGHRQKLRYLWNSKWIKDVSDLVNVEVLEFFVLRKINLN